MRLDRLRHDLHQRRLDATALIAGPNLSYLTGLSFHLSERPTVGFFPAQGEPVFVCGQLEESKLAEGLPFAARICTYTDAGGPATAFAQAARALPHLTTLAVETRRMRVFELHLIQTHFPTLRVEAAEPVLAALRMTKDPTELAAMRRAVAIAEQAFAATVPLIQLGMTEHDLAAELVTQTLRAGSSAELPFAPIVASGPNSALPHASVTERRLQAGDLLTLDWGAAFGGYMADLTRTLGLGTVEAELRHIHAVVEQANAAARAHARPGVTCASVDEAARAVIHAAGYGDLFTHRVGHGLGLEGHEDPSMHGNNPMVLTEGMTFTIEPGIYVPGRGGVRIEDDVVITPNGCESLSTLPRGWHALYEPG